MKIQSGLRVEEIKGSLEDAELNSHSVTLKPFNPATYSLKRVHRLACVNAAATLLLLFVGGLVTSKGAGLAVPDWPTTFGHNMFLYPWSKMVGDIFYEHSHRLVASGVGLLTVALALLLWFQDRRNWLRSLGLAALGLVIFQGVIGGLRVVLLEQTLAIVHACFAQAFFAVTVSLAIFTSKEWTEEPKVLVIGDGARLRRLCVITIGLIYLQAIFGAVLRHTGERLDAHLFFATLVTIHVILVIARIMRFHSDQTKLVRPAMFLGVLLSLQLALGMGSYLSKFSSLIGLPSWGVVTVTTTHLVTGALMLVTALLLTLRSYRLFSRTKSAATQTQLTEQFSV